MYIQCTCTGEIFYFILSWKMKLRKWHINAHVHVHVVYHTNGTNCYYNLLITQNMDTHTHTNYIV